MTHALALSARLVRGMAFPAILVVVGCQAGASTAPSLAVGTVPLEVGGTWERCHQMGACEYTIELATAQGSATAELVRLSATGDTGSLVVEDGFPAKLSVGAHEVTVLSTMYGDTLEPNGELTRLGEEARCFEGFVVAEGATRVLIEVSLRPGRCTIDVAGADGGP